MVNFKSNTMKILLSLALLPMFFAMSACTTFAPQGKLIERDGISILETPPYMKVAILKKHGNQDRICAPRSLDFAETQSTGGDFGFTNSKFNSSSSDGIGEKSTQGALSLGGRNPAVLILREMTYRACEMAMNTNADEKQTLEIYTRFLNIAQKMIITQQGSGTAVLGVSASQVTMQNAPVVSDNSDTNYDTTDNSETQTVLPCSNPDSDPDTCT